MLTIFVDESGNLGTDGRYFVIALIVPQRKKRIVNFMKRFCAENKLQEVKGTLLSTPQKQKLLNHLNTFDDHNISYVVVDKSNVDNKKLFEDKNLLYNYAFQWLIKPVLRGTNEDVEILLDNHTTKVKSINTLCDYIRLKAYTEWGITSTINIRYCDSKASKIVQMADVIANVIYGHYTYDVTHLYSLLKIDRSIKFPAAKFNK